MQYVTFIASKDLTIKCESGTVEYKRGDLVELNHDKDDNVWLSYHEEKENEIHAFELSIKDKSVFESILSNVVLVSKELDEKHSYEEMALEDLLIEQGLDLVQLMQLMVEANYRNLVSESNTIKVPVHRVNKTLSSKQKAVELKNSIPSERQTGVKVETAKAVEASILEGLNESYFIDTESLFNNSIEKVSSNVFESLKSYFSDNAKVTLTNENKIKVNLFNATEDQLEEALNSLEVNYVVEGTDDYKLITLYKPQPKSVVESFYAEEEEVLEEACQYMEKAKSMYKEMCGLYGGMGESDGEDEDKDKMKDLMESYKAKMDKMKEMEDKDKVTTLKGMEGDYHKFLKMIKKGTGGEEPVSK